MEKLTIIELTAKYSGIEDKIPSVWETYEKAGIELAQDLSFGHWDIKEPELYRVISLVQLRVPRLRITQHLDNKFAYMGLYPHIHKPIDIVPENKKMNLYLTDKELFVNLCKERRESKEISFNKLAIDHLKKSWFSVIEKTGGGAEANIDSVNYEERALAHIENAIKELNQHDKT